MKNKSIPEAESTLRVPPHSIEAEQSVLGGLLLNNEAWDSVGDLLLDHHFYRWEHRLIYAVLGQLINASHPADVITAYEQLKSQGRADECGGLAYLNALAQSVPSAAGIRRYAEIVREQALLRELVAAGDKIATEAFNPRGRPVSQVLDECEACVLAIGERSNRSSQTWQSMSEITVKLIDEVSARSDAGGSDVIGVRTGFPDLDRMTTGLQPGDLIILAARPSMGKTALALNIAEHVAMREGLPIAIFSMEMGTMQLGRRMAGSAGRIDIQRLQTGRLRDDEWSRLATAIEELGRAPIYIDETAGLSHPELRARARRLARQCGKLGLVVVDYLQLMSAVTGTDGKGAAAENRATEIAEISRNLKALAKELQCPVIALSQLNRSVETRTDKRPMMSDLRESGAIEQDADVIMFIYRDDYYSKDSKEPGVAELILSKQRNGPVGTVKLTFLKPLARFESLLAS
jgi:replicative DNA helicase